MKYLIKPEITRNPMGNSDCRSRICGYDTGGCPYLCITRCPHNKHKCYKPTVPGMSPRGAGNDND